MTVPSPMLIPCLCRSSRRSTTWLFSNTISMSPAHLSCRQIRLLKQQRVRMKVYTSSFKLMFCDESVAKSVGTTILC